MTHDLNYDDFFNIIDNLYDEIWVYDNNYKIVYVNKAVKRHYGLNPEDIIGKNFYEMLKFWEPSVLPTVYKSKKIYAIRQYSNIGVELFNIATPIFDENGEMKFVATSVRDKLFDNILIHSDYEENPFDYSDIICVSESMKKCLRIAEKLSDIDSICLITGESGTGKTMLSKYIHDHSPRKDKPFVSINFSAIPADLLESELFGYKKGAFTGANANGKQGLLETAVGGTVLLDEIGEIPYAIQAKLLQVIQEKTFFPVGSNKPVQVDIKIIAATNRDLQKLCATGLFREDLYYRLKVFEIYLPPLRERQEDIEPLIFYFLNKYSKKYSLSHKIAPKTVDILKSSAWRGNIRELSNTIERMVVITENFEIEPSDLPSDVFTYQNENSREDIALNSTFDEAIEEYEAKIITKAYKKYKTTRQVAKALSISQTRATNLLKKYIKKND